MLLVVRMIGPSLMCWSRRSKPGESAVGERQHGWMMLVVMLVVMRTRTPFTDVMVIVVVVIIMVR